MLQAVVAGCVLGGIYAIMASSLVITYVSAGVLNFAFGAVAFFIARLYYFLNSQEHWAILPSALVSIVLAGPVLGMVLWALLFRLLNLASQLIKIVATIGLLVAIPAITGLIFGGTSITAAPGLAPEPEHVFHIAGVAVTLDQVIVYACVIVVLGGGAGILRFTDAGLKVRSLVDSEAMTSLSGANPLRISLGVWAVTTGLAGLAGVLVAPIIGLDPNQYTLLLAAAFAAAVAAKLRRIGVAVVVGLLMGIASDVIQTYMPPTSSFTTAIVPSIPFAFILVFIVYEVARRGRSSGDAVVGGALDRALLPQGETGAVGPVTESSQRTSRISLGVFIVVAAILPMVLSGFWVGLIGLGAAYGLVFLAFTLVTGEGGMIWLCEVTFAGFGAIATGQLATVYHWPVLLAVVIGGLVSGVLGAVVGLLTIRLGDIYVALVTLTFGLLADNLVFVINRFSMDNVGVTVNPPNFAQSGRVLSYVMLVSFCLIALLITRLRRSTLGLAIRAVRWSEDGAKTLGIGVLGIKILVATFAAFVAGVGGGLLSIYAGSALPSDYSTLIGVVWLAVLVTNGIRSIGAALAAGMAFSILPALVLTYLPQSWGDVSPALFGLGAIVAARNPEGILAKNAAQLHQLVLTIRRRRQVAAVGGSIASLEGGPR